MIDVQNIIERADALIWAKESRKAAAEYHNADQRAEACQDANEVIEACWMALAEAVCGSPEAIKALCEVVEKANAFLDAQPSVIQDMTWHTAFNELSEALEPFSPGAELKG